LTTEKEEGAWVPFSELEKYLDTLKTALTNITANIDTTVDQMKEFIKSNEGDNTDG
tara:strand:- start:208 stop:375 length:168 start_codon:yes stop_codon:yes gene_type:complete